MVEPSSRAEIMQWRKVERARLIEQRQKIPPRERHAGAARMMELIAERLGPISRYTIGLYWPIRAEPNLLPLLAKLETEGNRGALPVVVRKGEPLIFRHWRDGEPLVPGVWNIPIPAEGDPVVPDILIAPVIGFDTGCYRLGYGGGFYDRTLAALPHRPRVIGVGWSVAAIPTIHPLPHDIPLDAIVTEQGVAASRG